MVMHSLSRTRLFSSSMKLLVCESSLLSLLSLHPCPLIDCPAHLQKKLPSSSRLWKKDPLFSTKNLAFKGLPCQRKSLPNLALRGESFPCQLVLEKIFSKFIKLFLLLPLQKFHFSSLLRLPTSFKEPEHSIYIVTFPLKKLYLNSPSLLYFISVFSKFLQLLSPPSLNSYQSTYYQLVTFARHFTLRFQKKM